MPERQLIQKALIEHLRSHDVAMQKRAIDALTDFVRVKAREENYKVPVKNCPIAPYEMVIRTIEGLPLYDGDLRPDADVRETLGRRLTLHAEKGQAEPRIDEVFVVASMVKMDDLLQRLTCVDGWELVKGDINPRSDSTTTFKLKNQYASRDFYADVTLSGDRKTITVDFR